MEENKKHIARKNNKGIIITFIAVVLSVVSIASVMVYSGNNNEPTSPWVSDSQISTAPDVSTSDIPVSATQQETTTKAETTSAPTTSSIEETTPQPTEPTEAPTTEYEPNKEEILMIVSDSINLLKSPNASYVGVKNQDITINVTDCSFQAFTGIINSVIDRLADEETFEYDFTNGVGIDPEENVQMNTTDAIAPAGVPFALTADGVISASFEKQGENTVYSVTLVPEMGTYQNPKPTHHGVSVDTLDFSLFEIPMGEITKADFNYPGAIVTVTLDPYGKVIGYSEHVDMNGIGEGRAMGITANASMEGYIHETWEIRWK